jgi:hypothetical protein
MQQSIDGFHVSAYLRLPDRQRRALHTALDRDLDDIDKWASAEGLTVPRIIRGDLEKKMECSALYLYRGWTVDRVHNQDGYRTSRVNMWLWIRQTLKLLDLPMRGQGRSRTVEKFKKIEQ